MIKTCRTCGGGKPLRAFDKNFGRVSLRLDCRACMSAKRIVYRKKRYAKDGVKMRDQCRKARQTPVGKLKHVFVQRVWRLLNPEKVKVYMIVAGALKKGILIKPLECNYPGCQRPNLEAHHFDYSLPLQISWFCKPHHFYADQVTRLLTTK